MSTGSLFGDRLEYLRRYFNILEKQDLATILQIHPATYSGYLKPPGEKNSRTPNYQDLLRIRRITGTSLDWLSGESEEPMWGPEVRSHRFRFRALAVANCGPQLDSIDRCRLVIADIRTALPALAEQNWYMPGLLYLTPEAYNTLVTVPDTDILGPQVMHRLSSFTGIPERWFRIGHASTLEAPADYGEYEPFVAYMVDSRIAPAEAMSSADSFRRLVETKRALP